MRQHAVRERRKLSARLVPGADERALAGSTRALHVFDHDAAPRQVDAKGHRAYGVDDAGLRPIDHRVGYDFIAQPDSEFSQGAGGGGHFASPRSPSMLFREIY